MLQYSYAEESVIPENVRSEYKKSEDGSWVLDGYSPKSKIDEFRTNNRALAKEKQELQDQLLKFKDIDPVKYAESVEKLKELENERLEAAGEWRVLKTNMEQAHAEQVKKEKDRAKAIQEGWNKEKIANQTAMIVMKHAIPEDGNMKYVQADILEMASIDETNQIVFLNEKGMKKQNEEGQALTLEDFLVKQYIPKSRLFKRSSGSGALGGLDIPMISSGQVSVDSVSGKDIPGSMIEKLASGAIRAV